MEIDPSRAAGWPIPYNIESGRPLLDGSNRFFPERPPGEMLLESITDMAKMTS